MFPAAMSLRKASRRDMVIPSRISWEGPKDPRVALALYKLWESVGFYSDRRFTSRMFALSYNGYTAVYYRTNRRFYLTLIVRAVPLVPTPICNWISLQFSGGAVVLDAQKPTLTVQDASFCEAALAPGQLRYINGLGNLESI